MENTIATINAIASKQRELGVWEKFERPEEEHCDATMEPPPAMKQSPFYFTTNMEYGRFQLMNRGFPDRNTPPEQVDGTGAQSGSELHSRQGTGANGEEAKAPQSQQESQEGIGSLDEDHNSFRKLPSGPKFPPIDPKYLAASRRGGRPDEDSYRRLTTGYAGKWMTNNCNRFWDNIQEVAPIAGYDVAANPQTPAAQILTVGEGDPVSPCPGSPAY